MSIIVTGAAGQLGRAVVGELKGYVGASGIVALSRDPAKIAHLGVATRAADFDHPESLLPAFDGAERLLIISTDAVGQRLEQHRNAIDAAAKARVGHVFYTSAPRATDDGNPAAVVPDHRGTEEALMASGLPHTALRNSIYTDMLLFSLPAAIAAGVLATNGGAGGTSYIPRADLAAATAAILADPGTPGSVLELTGQAAVSDAEIAAIASEVTGKEIAYQELSDDQLVGVLTQSGMDETAARMTASFGQATREGYLGVVSDVVEHNVGHKPTSVAEFLAKALTG